MLISAQIDRPLEVRLVGMFLTVRLVGMFLTDGVVGNSHGMLFVVTRMFMFVYLETQWQGSHSSCNQATYSLESPLLHWCKRYVYR